MPSAGSRGRAGRGHTLPFLCIRARPPASTGADVRPKHTATDACDMSTRVCSTLNTNPETGDNLFMADILAHILWKRILGSLAYHRYWI